MLTPRLPISDDLYTLYEREAVDRDMQLETILAKRLEAAAPLAGMERWVILTGDDLHAVEEKLGGGHLLSSADLRKKVDRLAKIEFGHHEITMTPGQMEEMVFRARKQGKTIEQIVEAMWRHMQQDFFRYA